MRKERIEMSSDIKIMCTEEWENKRDGKWVKLKKLELGIEKKLEKQKKKYTEQEDLIEVYKTSEKMTSNSYSEPCNIIQYHVTTVI